MHVYTQSIGYIVHSSSLVKGATSVTPWAWPRHVSILPSAAYCPAVKAYRDNYTCTYIGHMTHYSRANTHTYACIPHLATDNQHHLLNYFQNNCTINETETTVSPWQTRCEAWKEKFNDEFVHRKSHDFWRLTCDSRLLILSNNHHLHLYTCTIH